MSLIAFDRRQLAPLVYAKDCGFAIVHMCEDTEVKQLINHPTYGVGEVVALIEPLKMNVVFADHIHRLVSLAWLRHEGRS